MFKLLPLLLVVRSYTQIDSWRSFEFSIPVISSGNDLLLSISKPSTSSALLFLGSVLSVPQFEFSTSADNWVTSAMYSDFQGWILNNSKLTLRIDYTVASGLSSIYLGIYKVSTSSITYDLSYSFISITSCNHICIYGKCSSGSCDCSNTLQIGYDCSIPLSTVIVGYDLNFIIPSYSWKFAIIQSSTEGTVDMDFKSTQPGLRIFQTQTADSQILPNMMNYQYQYRLALNETHSTFSISTSPLAYWVWGMYCYSDSSCHSTIKLNYPSTSIQSFMWIIIATIVSLAVMCIATPIILRIVLRYRERRAARVIGEIVENRKNELRVRFPGVNYVEKAEKMACIICFEDFFSDSIVRNLQCLHVFHAKCIDEWYLNNNKCPLCKRDFFAPQIEVSDIEA